MLENGAGITRKMQMRWQLSNSIDLGHYPLLSLPQIKQYDRSIGCSSDIHIPLMADHRKPSRLSCSKSIALQELYHLDMLELDSQCESSLNPWCVPFLIRTIF